MTSVSSYNATSGLAPSAASQSTNPTSNLDQADFLQLLVTQMTSQDPLDPESDTDMAAQMAQFSSLQASENTEQDVEGLQANALLGRIVNVNSSGRPQIGVVSSVQFQTGSEPQLVVNGQTYGLSQLSAIYPTTQNTASGTPQAPANKSNPKS
jgi:flagellar basal-body rod modification protein FlgD